MNDQVKETRKGSVGEYAARLLAKKMFLRGAVLAAIVFVAGLLISSIFGGSSVLFYVQLVLYSFAMLLCAIGAYYLIAGKFSKKLQDRLEKNLREAMRKQTAGKKKKKKGKK